MKQSGLGLPLATGDRVWILHASTALGAASYERIEGEWRLADDFSWCCRSATDPAEAEALLAAEGWVSNIVLAGTSEHVEFRVAWPDEETRVALSHVPRLSRVAYWPVDLSDDTKEALYGVREPIEPFVVERWFVVAPISDP